MQIAQLAVEAQSEEDKEILRQRIDEFKATAEYGTIEEALEAQKWSGS